MVVSNDPLMHDSLFSPPVMTRSCEVSPMMGAKFGSVIIQSYDTEQSASLVDAQRVESVCVRSSHAVHDKRNTNGVVLASTTPPVPSDWFKCFFCFKTLV